MRQYAIDELCHKYKYVVLIFGGLYNTQRNLTPLYEPGQFIFNLRHFYHTIVSTITGAQYKPHTVKRVTTLMNYFSLDPR